MLLSDWADEYAGSNLGLSSGSADQLRIAVRRFQQWARRPIQTKDLSAELLTGFLRALLDAGYSPATVNSKRRCLLLLWRTASEEGYAPPLPNIRPAREPLRIPDSWTLEEVSQLLRYCQRLKGRVGRIPAGLYYYSLFLALYDTGERIGAMLACRVEDFSPADSGAGAVWVAPAGLLDEASPAAIRSSGLLPDLSAGGFLRIRAETHKCRRERLCALSPETTEAITRSLAHVTRRLVWPWPHSRRHCFRCLRRLIEDAGLPVGRGAMCLTHRLRRTSGSLVEAHGGDGSRHLGNSRRVFEQHYLDPRVVGNGQLDRLPRPRL